MLKQVYTSATIRYQTLAEQHAGAFGSAAYNTWLITAPRIYAETPRYLSGLWAEDTPTLTGFTIVNLLYTNYRVKWPGWGVRWHQFDGGSGNRITDVDLSIGLGPANNLSYASVEITKGWDGSFWHRNIYDTLSRMNPYNWTFTGEKYVTSYWGANYPVHSAVISKVHDLALLSRGSSWSRAIEVHTLSTGALVRTINVVGPAVAIFHAGGTRCYVANDVGVLTLVDYATGDVLGVLSVPLDGGSDAFGSRTRYAWDPYGLRILRIEMTADASDGASTSLIKGYYPYPIATRIMPPLPLKAPRKYRTIPIATALVSDNGEPITGERVTATETGAGSLIGNQVPTDRNGIATFQFNCNSSGAAHVEVSAL